MSAYNLLGRDPGLWVELADNPPPGHGMGAPRNGEGERSGTFRVFWGGLGKLRFSSGSFEVLSG